MKQDEAGSYHPSMADPPLPLTFIEGRASHGFGPEFKLETSLNKV